MNQTKKKGEDERTSCDGRDEKEEGEAPNFLTEKKTNLKDVAAKNETGISVLARMGGNRSDQKSRRERGRGGRRLGGKGEYGAYGKNAKNRGNFIRSDIVIYFEKKKKKKLVNVANKGTKKTPPSRLKNHSHNSSVGGEELKVVIVRGKISVFKRGTFRKVVQKWGKRGFRPSRHHVL